VFIIKN